MWSMVIVEIAFLLDFIFGDPIQIPHIVCKIGNLISTLERWLRKRVKNEFVAGEILTLLVISICYAVPFFLLFFLYRVHLVLGIVVEVFICFQMLATKSLWKAAADVYNELAKGNVADARVKVSYIVGRDTEQLDEIGIIKATVETVAENTTDGVIAPLFYMMIGGAPLAVLYKSINTMDSMIGYKNEKYRLFGCFAAKLDDIANFIPARIAAGCMIIASFISGFDGKNATKIFLRDRKNHASPNSAQTESVCAGALRIQLAGIASYFGKVVEKPTIGDSIRPIEATDIKKANQLLYMTSIVGLMLMVAIRSFL